MPAAPEPVPVILVPVVPITVVGTRFGLAAKALTSLVVVALTGLVAAYSDSVVTGYEWCTLVVAPLLTALVVRLTPVAKGAAALAAAVLAGVSVLATGLADGDGLSQVEAVMIAVAVFAALERAYNVPNAPASVA